jgi:hypothetical protein
MKISKEFRWRGTLFLCLKGAIFSAHGFNSPLPRLEKIHAVGSVQ